MSAGSQIDVSVIVPVYNEGEVLHETTAAMLALDFAGALEFIFVDGGSDDGSRELLAALEQQDPRVQLHDNPSRVEPAALNIGIRASRGTYVALLNAHCWFPPDYLARGVERLDADDATWVTGPAIPRERDWFSRAVARALVTPLGAGGSRKWRRDGAPDDEEVELDTGLFAGVVRRDLLLELGPFEEDWVVNHDSEMAARVLEAGGRIVQLSSMGAHYHPRNRPADLWRQYWRFGFYRVRTSQRHPVALRPFHLAAASLALTPPAAVLAPRSIRRLARGALAGYSLVLGRAAITADRDGAPVQRAAVAGALAIMHFGWGAGFLSGLARFGIPVQAVLSLLRRGS